LTYLHEKLDKLLEKRDRLHRLLDRPHMSVLSTLVISEFQVRTHSMTPFHGCFRINPFPVVVRSSVGSWNIKITPSDVACTSGMRALSP
jgi:hypothetical protein